MAARAPAPAAAFDPRRGGFGALWDRTPRIAGRRPSQDDLIDEGCSLLLSSQRVEMRQLASDFQVGRSTLYRWFGDRDGFLGEVLWRLTLPSLRWADEHAEGLHGPSRLVTVARSFVLSGLSTPGIKDFVRSEPETALRVVTGTYQGQLVRAFAGMIQREQQASYYPRTTDAASLALGLVRFTESLLYVDQITGANPRAREGQLAMLTLLRA